MKRYRYPNFSTTPPSRIHPTAQPLVSESLDQQAEEVHFIEALVGCQVPTTTDPQVEQMLAVRGLEQAAKLVRKDCFAGLEATYHSYVNDQGSAILTNIEAMRGELATLRKAGDTRAQESDERARKADERARKADDRTSRLEKSFNKFKEETAEWSAMIEPAYQVGVRIRLRFWYNYCLMKGRKTSAGMTAVRTGNIAAHCGDFVADTLMMRRGDITDMDTFFELYGVAYKDAESYTSK